MVLRDFVEIALGARERRTWGKDPEKGPHMFPWLHLKSSSVEYDDDFSNNVI